MRIIKLVISNHNRITLGNRYIEYTPSKKLGIILGDNGSGKSTFLGLLFPRVVKLDELEADGFVTLVVQVGDDRIEIATYKNTSIYSFILNGKEMNPKSSVRLQDELIKTYIKINKDIHDILTGADVFHKSSVKKRRDILEYLSGNDYSYINALYMHINKKYNAEKAILKHTDGRLSDAKLALSTLEKGNESHDSDIKVARKRLEDIIELSNSSARGIDITSLEERLGDANKSVDYYKSSIKSLLRNASKFPIGSYSKMQQWLEKLETISNHLYAEINILSARHLKLSERSSENEDHFVKRRALANTIADDEKLLKTISKPALELLKHLPSRDIPTLRSNIDTYKFKLLDMADIPEEDFKLPVVDNDIIAGLKATYISLDEKSKHLENEKILLDSIANEKDIECPKCHNTFKQGYDAKKHHMLKKSIDALASEMPLLDSQIKDLVDKSERGIRARKALSVFNSFIDNLDNNLKDFFNKGFPSSIVANLQTLRSSIRFRIEYDKVANNIAKNKERLLALEELDVSKMENERKELDSLEEEIKEVRTKRQKVLTLLENVKSVIRSSNEVEKASDKVLLANEDIKEIIALRKAYLFQLYLDKEIAKARDALYQLENIEVRISRHKKDIEAINALIAKLSVNVEAYKHVVQIIHPKGKEIAKSIIGFLNIFIDSVNKHISKVWTYPVELLYIEEEEGVTYRLPFKADGKTRDDISLASTATGDMINIGVKLTIMETLSMEGYPLYLDELGSGYDIEHSKTLCLLIEQLSEDDDYSNIFVVSNDPDVAKHLSTMNADLIVLANNNI